MMRQGLGGRREKASPSAGFFEAEESKLRTTQLIGWEQMFPQPKVQEGRNDTHEQSCCLVRFIPRAPRK